MDYSYAEYRMAQALGEERWGMPDWQQRMFKRKVATIGYKEWYEFIISIAKQHCFCEAIRIYVKSDLYPSAAQYFDGRIFVWNLLNFEYEVELSHTSITKWIIFRFTHDKKPTYFIQGKTYTFTISDYAELPKPGSARFHKTRRPKKKTKRKSHALLSRGDSSGDGRVSDSEVCTSLGEGKVRSHEEG